ncbi:hypothetical protein IH824_15330 [candidate division KSB1 bacterium]|nr:hypothetical protein [candidate division KSB1 bacterium]
MGFRQQRGTLNQDNGLVTGAAVAGDTVFYGTMANRIDGEVMNDHLAAPE